MISSVLLSYSKWYTSLDGCCNLKPLGTTGFLHSVLVMDKTLSVEKSGKHNLSKYSSCCLSIIGLSIGFQQRSHHIYPWNWGLFERLLGNGSGLNGIPDCLLLTMVVKSFSFSVCTLPFSSRSLIASSPESISFCPRTMT